MRIDSHIFQIVLIGVLFIPMLNFFNFSLSFILLVFWGLFCGAMYPDTDCKESRIFKMKQDTSKIGWQSSYREYRTKRNAQNIHNTLLFIYSSILIFLGSLFRYVLYYPSYGVVYLINKKWIKEDSMRDEHRGISHTLFGVFIASILFSILLFFVNLYFRLATPLFLIVISLAFFFAGNLHLLQDSISKWGVKWLYPFRETTVFGDYSAFSQDIRMLYFVFALIAFDVLVFFLTDYVKNNFASLLLISTILLPIIFLILSFLLLFKSCGITFARQSPHGV